MMGVGIPVYVCATASVPIAAALIAKGVSPGAALVFLMTGPATNAATLTTVWRIMGKRVAAIYLGAVAVSAIAAGLLLDAVFTARGVHAIAHAHGMIPGWAGSIAAAILIGVLVFAFFRPSRIGAIPQDDGTAKRVRISIGGMTCNHCAGAVQRALAESRGVSSAAVDLKAGEAIVVGDAFEEAQLAKAIEALGYTVERIERTGA
jgi:copper chaperone CopZ